ncbi:hypothetical protein C2845_PM13G25340 [Panicum miliaceum]|uniref:Uncharacterized protein n=1 Tax=Panicum miliaceum TaxID=4540 RepID=A0A3L6RN12_PANMI|nr:hypothetical protein C2845_PM13G25340 [Panicum miliaceum]
MTAASGGSGAASLQVKWISWIIQSSVVSLKSGEIAIHLSACETVGSAGTVRTDKTGIVMTNHMVVDEVAKGSADVIVFDDNFTTIINLGRWDLAFYMNIQKFMQFQLIVNIVAIVIHFVFACITGAVIIYDYDALLYASMVVPLFLLYYYRKYSHSSAVVVGRYDYAYLRSFSSTEPPNDEIMKRPPVRRGESFITKVLW